MTSTGESAGATVIIGPSPQVSTPQSLTSTLLRVRDLLKSPNGASLILDYRVRQAVFAIETELGGIRHGS